MIEAKYVIDHLDQRDGNKHVMLLHWKDTVTGISKSFIIAYFEPEAGKVAEEMAVWANQHLTGDNK